MWCGRIEATEGNKAPSVSFATTSIISSKRIAWISFHLPTARASAWRKHLKESTIARAGGGAETTGSR